MIFPTLWVTLYDRKSTDRFGQPKLTRTGRVLVAPVKLAIGQEKTTVRTDSSGSHGSARETTADVVVLARTSVRIDMGDVLEINGHKVLVVGIHPRYTVTGQHDHNEFHCDAWV